MPRSNSCSSAPGRVNATLADHLFEKHPFGVSTNAFDASLLKNASNEQTLAVQRVLSSCHPSFATPYRLPKCCDPFSSTFATFRRIQSQTHQIYCRYKTYISYRGVRQHADIRSSPSPILRRKRQAQHNHPCESRRCRPSTRRSRYDSLFSDSSGNQRRRDTSTTSDKYYFR